MSPDAAAKAGVAAYGRSPAGAYAAAALVLNLSTEPSESCFGISGARTLLRRALGKEPRVAVAANAKEAFDLVARHLDDDRPVMTGTPANKRSAAPKPGSIEVLADLYGGRQAITVGAKNERRRREALEREEAAEKDARISGAELAAILRDEVLPLLVDPKALLRVEEASQNAGLSCREALIEKVQTALERRAAEAGRRWRERQEPTISTRSLGEAATTGKAAVEVSFPSNAPPNVELSIDDANRILTFLEFGQGCARPDQAAVEERLEAAIENAAARKAGER